MSDLDTIVDMYRAIVQAEKTNSPIDLYNAMDKTGKAGKLDNATTSWANWRILEANYYAETHAPKDAPAFGFAGIQAFNKFRAGTLQIIAHNMHQTPAPFAFIGDALSAVGKFAGDVVHLIGKIPFLGPLLNVIVHVVPILSSITGAIESCVSIANTVIDASSVVKSALDGIPDVSKTGFKFGVGIMTQAGLTSLQFAAARNSLDEASKTGFDSAVALHIGRINHPAPKGMAPHDQAAFELSHGLLNASPEMIARINGAIHHSFNLTSMDLSHIDLNPTSLGGLGGFGGWNFPNGLPGISTVPTTAPVSISMQQISNAFAAGQGIPINTTPAHQEAMDNIQLKLDVAHEAIKVGWFHRLLRAIHLEKTPSTAIASNN